MMGRRMGTGVVLAALVAVALSGATTSSGATGTDELYVSDWSGGTIEKVDTGAGTVGPPIPVGQGVVDIAITPDGHTAYTVSAIGDAVVPVDLETPVVGPTIAVTCPTSIAIVPGGAKAYVTQWCETTVTPIDLTTNTAGTPIEVGPAPFDVAITPDGSTAYVTTGGSQAAQDALVPIEVDSDTVGAAIPIGSAENLGSVVITPDGSTAFVAREDVDTVVPVDLATRTAGTPIDVAADPVALALTPNGATLFVAHYQRVPNGLGGDEAHDVTPIDVATRTALARNEARSSASISQNLPSLRRRAIASDNSTTMMITASMR